jgi:hypothetical protein
MAQAVKRWCVTAKARDRTPVTPCGMCCGNSSAETGFSPSFSVLSCRCHSAMAVHVHCDLGDEIGPLVAVVQRPHPIAMNMKN